MFPAIVIVGSRPYSARVPLGDWQLARAFARLGHPVLYVDPPVHVLRPRNYLAPRRPPDLPGEPPVANLRPIALGARRPWRLAGLVSVLVGLQVRLWLLMHRWSTPLVVTVAPERGIPRLMGQFALVYWQKDRQWASQVHRRPQWLGQRHRELLAAADVATGVSPEIVADGLGQQRQVHLIPNGVERPHFAAPQPQPVEYAPLSRPRIVFVGSWGWRVDKELFVALATRRPHWTFITVAPPRAAEQVALPNVVNVGPRDYAELPAYLQHADVGIVPYREEPFNAASAPLKILEYLASGLPVVASAVLRGGAVEDVRYAESLDDWLSVLDEIVAQGRGPRPNVVGHGWEDRCRELLRLAAPTGQDLPVSSPPGVSRVPPPLLELSRPVPTAARRWRRRGWRAAWPPASVRRRPAG